jgi:hypothetical protein
MRWGMGFCLRFWVVRIYGFTDSNKSAKVQPCRGKSTQAEAYATYDPDGNTVTVSSRAKPIG